MKKGQLSIEVIILLAIFLLFFQAMILPSIEFAENTLKDTHAIIQSKKSIDAISENLEQFASSSGYGSRIMFLYLPKNTIITDCNSISKEINYKILISTQRPTPAGCSVDGVCLYSKKLNIFNDLTCTTVGPGFSGHIKISKDKEGNLDIDYNEWFNEKRTSKFRIYCCYCNCSFN